MHSLLIAQTGSERLSIKIRAHDRTPFSCEVVSQLLTVACANNVFGRIVAKDPHGKTHRHVVGFEGARRHVDYGSPALPSAAFFTNGSEILQVRCVLERSLGVQLIVRTNSKGHKVIFQEDQEFTIFKRGTMGHDRSPVGNRCEPAQPSLSRWPRYPSCSRCSAVGRIVLLGRQRGHRPRQTKNGFVPRC